MDDTSVKLILDRFDRIESKIDVIQAHASAIDSTLTGQAKDIEYHIKRTDLLQVEVSATSAARQRVNGAWLLIGGVATLLGIVWVTLQILGLR